MKSKKVLCILLVVTLLLALSGCGAKSQAAPMDRAESPQAGIPANGAENVFLAAGAQKAVSQPLPENRKWVITMELYAQTENLDTASAAIQQQIQEMEGYVEDQRIQNGSQYDAHRYRRAEYTIRIPAQKADSFTQAVSGVTNLVSQQKELEDITLRYVDTENRIAALEAQQARLMELLEAAQTTADLLEIEDQLTDVRYELENMASQKRLFDNQIDYATIHLELEEVREYTPLEEPTLWQRIRTGFVNSLESLGRLAVNLLVFLLAGSPYLLLIGAVTLVIVLLVKRRRRKKKQEK